MKLFPHILSRVGGFPFQQLDDFSFGEMEFVNTLLEFEKKRATDFQKILDSFSTIFHKTENYRFRAVLNNAQKDFRKHRFSFIKKIKKEIPTEIKENVKVLLEKIEKYQTILLQIEKLKNELEILFEKEKQRQLTELQKFSADENFQKAILHSSRSFYHSIQSFQKKDVLGFRKKEKQTARSIAQYMYRAIAKTSPFSYFTTLDILSLENDVFKNSKETKTESFIQVNNFILAESQQLLLQNPTFFKNLKIKLNPSIQLENEEFLFFKNEKNVEVFQRLEASEVLLCLHNKIFTSRFPFCEIVDEMSELIEAESEALEDYLLQIIETGFLEWDWEISAMQLGWENKFYEWIATFQDFDGKKLWVNFLNKLVEDKKEYTTADVRTREFLQKSTKENLERLGFKNVTPELIFFEDVKIPRDYSLEKKKIEPIVESLDKVLRLMEPLAEDDMKNKIRWFWENHFGQNESVPLLNFYEQFFETDFSEFSFSQKGKKEWREEWKNILQSKFRRGEDGFIHFSTSDFEDLGDNWKPARQLVGLSPKGESKTQYSALLQFFQDNEKTKAVINGVTPGFGKLFGRFLPLFENEITIDLQNWNKELRGEDSWIENVDASFFNANVHPPLLDLEIKIPNGQNQLSKASRISISDLEVVWDEKEDCPILVFSKNKKRVYIFDFGFEHPSNRSPMFQLLNGFSLKHSTYKIFTSLVNELFLEKKENGIVVFPRIIIDEHLILQRSSQNVPVSFFPNIERNETASNYFLRIQSWKNEEHITRYIFIRPLIDSNFQKRRWSKDFYKPQLIDLESPFAIVLLQKVLEKHDGKIKMEEMLPDLGSVKGSDYIREDVVQWSF